MRDRKRQMSGACRLPRSTVREDQPRAPAGWLHKPAARAQDWCVLTLTSRFMNDFVIAVGVVRRLPDRVQVAVGAADVDRVVNHEGHNEDKG
jgi:hypothetical protein